MSGAKNRTVKDSLTVGTITAADYQFHRITAATVRACQDVVLTATAEGIRYTVGHRSIEIRRWKVGRFLAVRQGNYTEPIATVLDDLGVAT